ncbi:MAG: DNA methyltransferase [Caldilineaceae bacterium]
MKPYQVTSVNPSPTFIESDNFPIDFLSLLAERESWRKEIYRPIYHMHKWWAKRLGTIFRGLLLGCLLPHDVAFEEEFYRSHNFAQVTVFDPFMGSGTTVGEAHKLGCTVLGRDINPIACESVRVAMGPLEEQPIQQAYFQLTEGIGKRIRDLCRTKDADGHWCDVLYFLG